MNFDPSENNTRSWMRILCAPIQRAEDALQQLLTMRSVDTATGVTLDMIGHIVGQNRVGDAMSDDDVYRRYIRARIAANTSRGLPEELITIARLIVGVDTGTVLVRCILNATFILELHDIPVDAATAQVLQDLLVAATSAGVRIVIEYSSVPLSGTFRFDAGPGFDVGEFAMGIDYRSVI